MSMSDTDLMGGSGYKVKWFSGVLIINAGASGDLRTLDAPNGRRIRLENLNVADTPGQQIGISISVDGELIVDSLTLDSSNANEQGQFLVSQAGTAPHLGAILSDVVGKQITISKSAGSTTQDISYSFSYGE